MSIYFDNVREYLIPARQRRGIVYIRDPPPSEEVTGATPAAPPKLNEAVVGKLREFYAQGDRFEVLRNFIQRESAACPVSLRVLEFLCTDNGVALESDRHLTDEYQHMLKAHSKAFFDVFARGDRFDFEVNGESVSTTVGQLQFFKWAIARGVLDRVEKEKERLLDEARRRKSGVHTVLRARAGRVEKRHREHQLVARVRFDGPFPVRLDVPKNCDV